MESIRYELCLTENKKKNNHGVVLTQLKYKRFVGDKLQNEFLGGWVESLDNITGTPIITGDAEIFDNAHIYEGVYINGNVLIYDNVKVSGKVSINGNTEISGNVIITNDINKKDKIVINGPADFMKDKLIIKGNVKILYDAVISGIAFQSLIDGNITISGSAVISSQFNITGNNILITDNATIERSNIEGNNITIYDKAFMRDEYIKGYENEDNDYQLKIGKNIRLYGGKIIAPDNDDLFLTNTNALLNKKHCIQKLRDFLYVENLIDKHGFTDNIVFYRGENDTIYVSNDNQFYDVKTLDQWKTFLDREIHQNKTEQTKLLIDLIRKTL